MVFPSRKRRLATRARALLGIVAGVCLAFEANAATPAATQSRLRQLARLPRLNFAVGVSFDSYRGFSMLGGRTLSRKEIAELQRAIQDNPADASRHVRLAQLYIDAGEDKEGKAAAARALELFRKRGAEQIDDGVLLAEFAVALSLTGENDEAERIARQAVSRAPNDWRPQTTLGRLLTAQAMASLNPAQSGGPSTSSPGAPGIPRSAPDPAQAERARSRVRESLECLDRAVELAPAQPEPYAARAAAHSARRLIEAALDSDASADPQRLRQVKALYNPAARDDLREVARRAPRNPVVLGTAALFEVLVSSLERGVSSLEALASGEAWSLLDDSTRQLVRASLAQLDELAQTTDTASAAAALEVLGTLQAFVVQDPRGAETSLRRAVELDPKRDPAWNTLVFLLAGQKRPADLLTVCTDWLRLRESARGRLLVAKAYEQLDQWDRALETVESLQRRYPDDLEAHLALAAALLHLSDTEAALPRAAQVLAKAEKLIGSNTTPEQALNFIFIRGLVLALAGQTERARADFRQILDLDSQRPEAREALDILEQAGSSPQ